MRILDQFKNTLLSDSPVASGSAGFNITVNVVKLFFPSHSEQ